MSTQVAVYGTLRFPPESMDSLRPHLRTLVSQTQQQDGCLHYEVGEDPFDPGLIRFFELWPDRDSLNRHLIAPHIEPWRKAARAHGLMDRQFVSYDLTGESIKV